MDIILIFLVALCIILFVIPLTIPTWKWFWISSGFIFSLFAFVWGQHYYLTSQPSHQGSPGEALGLYIVGLLSFAFLLGMLSRYIRWLIELKIAEIKNNKKLSTHIDDNTK